MFCSNCGSQVGDNEKFCKVCGTPVNVQSAMPMMQQTPVNQQPVSEQPVPASRRGRTYGPQERRKANKLCIISLILGVVVPLVIGILLGMAENFGLSANYTDYYSILLISELPISAAMIAGIVLMIVVRVKYSKSKFGLVLMIIYCVYLAVALIFFIIALSSCSDFIGSSSCS